MDCDLIRQDLIAFCLGDIDDKQREQIEAHLLSCATCLQELFTYKRAIERSEAKPSEAAKARLRDAVERKLALRRPKVWLWWQRPLAVAVAAASIILAAAAINVLKTSPGRAPHAGLKLP